MTGQRPVTLNVGAITVEKSNAKPNRVKRNPHHHCRCERCQRVLLAHENRFCWLCHGHVAIYGTEVDIG